MLLGGCGPIAILLRTLGVKKGAVRVWVLSIDDGNGLFLTQAYSGAGSGSVYGLGGPIGRINRHGLGIKDQLRIERALNMLPPT